MRRDSADAQANYARFFGSPQRSTSADQAAVVHFGSLALGLARSSTPPPAADTTAAKVNDAAAVDSTEAQAAYGATADGARATAAGATSAKPAEEAPAEEEQEPTDEEKHEVTQMQQRDREVRAHEQAHKAAGGGHAGSIRLTYQMGPDGKRYAVEGEVPIDVSPVPGDPAATLRKMEAVHRAANAPASPSGADRSVAATASRQMQQARAQLAAERYAKAQDMFGA